MKSVFPPGKSLHIAVISAVIALVYSNSLVNGFNFDDDYLIIDNTAVHGFSLDNITRIFTTASNGLEYLPVRDLTYLVDFAFWGLNPFGYHLANLIYYILFCTALYLFLTRLLARASSSPASIAFLSSLLYAVHPVHVESVAGIAQRKDLLSGLFFLLSLSAYLRFRESGKRGYYIFSSILYIFALLSKGTVVVLPLVLILMETVLPGPREEGLRSRLLKTIPFFVLTAVYVFFQGKLFVSAGVILPQEIGAAGGLSGRFYVACQVTMHYLKLLAIPYPLQILHPVVIKPLIWQGLAAIMGVAALLFSVPYLRRRQPVAAFAVGWFIVCLIPVSGLIPTGTLLAERYLFLPSVGFSLAVGWFFDGRSRWRVEVRRLALLLLFFLVAITGFISHNRNKDWKDMVTLYLANIRDTPGRPRLYWYVGQAYLIRHQYSEGFYYLDMARRLNPAYAIDYAVFEVWHHLQRQEVAMALEKLGRIDNPKKWDILEINYLYGKVHEAKGDRDAARVFYEKALSSPVRLEIFLYRDIRRKFESFK